MNTILFTEPILEQNYAFRFYMGIINILVLIFFPLHGYSDKIWCHRYISEQNFSLCFSLVVFFFFIANNKNKTTVFECGSLIQHIICC